MKEKNKKKSFEVILKRAAQKYVMTSPKKTKKKIDSSKNKE